MTKTTDAATPELPELPYAPAWMFKSPLGMHQKLQWHPPVLNDPCAHGWKRLFTADQVHDLIRARDAMWLEKLNAALASQQGADAKIKAAAFTQIAKNSEMLFEVRDLISTLTDPKAHCPGRTEEARRLLPLLDSYLHQPAAATPAARVPEGFRPIATAPRDGTEVLAWNIEGKSWHQVYWKSQANWTWVAPFSPHWAMRWNDEYHQADGHFSRWMPIPAAPDQTDGSGHE